MRRVLTCVFPVLFLVLAGGLVLAGDDEPAKKEVPDRVLEPFLWVIPGEVPSYLFGTAHSTDERITNLHPKVREAFDAAGAAYFEIDMIKDLPGQMAALKLPPDKKTADIIPADLLKRLDARLTKIHPMITRDQVGELKPFAWVVLVPNLYEQMKKPGVPMLDAMLHGQAMRTGKAVGGLEDPVEQTAFMDTVTDEEAVLMLRVTLDQWDEFDEKGEDPTGELVGHYLRGDEQAMVAYAKEMMASGEVPEELSKRIWKAIGPDRNARMAKAIAKLLKENPERRHFFAVGAMHLLGEDSVQDFLKKLAIETRRVKADEPAKKADADKPAEKKREPAGAGAGG